MSRVRRRQRLVGEPEDQIRNQRACGDAQALSRPLPTFYPRPSRRGWTALCDASRGPELRVPAGVQVLSPDIETSPLRRAVPLVPERWPPSKRSGRLDSSLGVVTALRHLAVAALQVERARVYAVPLAGGLGAVVEDVPQVRAAGRARHLDPVHEVTGVVVELHGVG